MKLKRVGWQRSFRRPTTTCFRHETKHSLRRVTGSGIRWPRRSRRGDAPENVSEGRDPETSCTDMEWVRVMPEGGDGFEMTIPTGVEDLPLDPPVDLVPDPSTV